MTATGEIASLGPRVQAEVERAIQRNIKGLEYFTSPAPVLGTTPKDALYKRGTLNLYHYRPLAEEVYRVPLLMVMATTNRGYIFDLAPGQSLVEFLLKQGYDVYLIDWSPPRPDEKQLRLEDYTLEFIPDCVRRVAEDCGEEEVTILGYCMGGVLSVIYAALHPEAPLKNLICFTTPIDWTHMGLFAKWARRDFFDVDRLVDALGNVPSELIFTSFEMLRPATRSAGQIKLWENMWNDEFVKSHRMFERWSADTLPLAGEYFRQTIKELMWRNALFENELTLGGKRADLGNIRAPVLHAVAEHDHIVPYDAAKPLVERVGSTDKQELVLKGGHVSVVAGGNAVKRLWPKLDAWLGGAFDMTSAEAGGYPRTIPGGVGDLELRYMTAADEAAVLAFARALPDHDLLFLPRDVAQPKVLAAWIAEIERGALTTLLAARSGTLVGCATIACEEFSWSAHVGEIRVVVAADMRGKGIGRLLIQETFRIALRRGLEKLIAQMTVDQRGAIAVFESMGFRGEALLRDHVKDRGGIKHDLVILSHDVARFQSQMEAYGLSEAR